MAKWKKFTIPLSPEDFMDVKLKIEKNEVTGFALNYRAKIGGNFYEVYRVDTAHGFLHEPRHWISSKPLPLHTPAKDLGYNVTFYVLQIKKNFGRYKEYFLQKKGRKNEV